MIVAVVDFNDWGLQIIALCDIGLERIITHLATGSERRNGTSSSSRRESALTTLPRGELFYHDLICFAMSEKSLSKLDKPARLSFSCSLDLLLNERRGL